MSADNWTICPKCNIDFEKKEKKIKLDAKNAYGNVSEEEYRELVKKASTPMVLEETLREDFGIGIRGEVFEVVYASSCLVCGFKYEFSHKKEIDLGLFSPKIPRRN